MYGPCLFTKTLGYGEKIGNGYLIDNEMFINDNKLFVNNTQAATLTSSKSIAQLIKTNGPMGINVQDQAWLMLAPSKMTIATTTVEEGDWYHSIYGIFSGVTWCSMLYINDNCIVYGSLQGNFTINNELIYSTPSKCAFLAVFNQTGLVKLYKSIGVIGEFTCSQVTNNVLYIGGHFSQSSWNGVPLDDNGVYLFTFTSISNPTINLLSTNTTYFNYILYPYYITSQKTSQFLGRIGSYYPIIFVTNSPNPNSKLLIVGEYLIWIGYFSNTLQVTNLYITGASDNDLGIVRVSSADSAYNPNRIVTGFNGVSTAGVSSFVTNDNVLAVSIYQREITPSIVKFVL